MHAKGKKDSDAVIKKAYKKLALLLHPDKCNEPGCEDGNTAGCVYEKHKPSLPHAPFSI
jgi:curved DNA-binding protein CbpA